MGTRQRVMVLAVTAVLVCAADQALKAWMRDLLSNGADIVLIPHVLNLHLVHNTGAAFGMASGMTWLLVAAGVAIVAACVALCIKVESGAPLTVALGCVVGGGVGNIIDRVSQGSVTDYLMTTFIDFPVFNLADIAITCGFVVALICFWRMGSHDGSMEGDA